MWSECVTICCPCGQGVLQYVAHVVRVSRHMPMWSECIDIYCISRCCLMTSIFQSYCPYGQSTLPYIAHVVRTYCHISRTWSECVTIHRINSYCLHGQDVSPFIVSIYAVNGQSVSLYDALAHIAHIISTTHYIAPIWSVSYDMSYQSYCQDAQNVSPYNVSIQTVHMVSMLYQIILPT